jgi:hypothetical protein
MDRLWTATMMKNRDSAVSIKNFYGTITDIEEIFPDISHGMPARLSDGIIGIKNISEEYFSPDIPVI